MNMKLRLLRRRLKVVDDQILKKCEEYKNENEELVVTEINSGELKYFEDISHRFFKLKQKKIDPEKKEKISLKEHQEIKKFISLYFKYFSKSKVDEPLPGKNFL